MTTLDLLSADDCRAAITLLRESKDLPVPQLLDLTDAALRKMVGVRDGLIERQRDGGGPDVRAALNQVNVALTEVASVQYPGALDREHVETAAAALEALLASSPH